MVGVAFIAQHIPYFNGPHLVAIAMAPVVPILLWAMLKGREENQWKEYAAYALAGLLFLHEIAYRIFHFSAAENTAQFLEHSLPISLCPLALFASMTALCRRSQLGYEIAYFWGFTASLNSLLTPNIQWAFPSFGFIGYFVSHCGVIWAVLYATLVLKMRPTWGSIWRAFLAFNITILILAGVNFLLGGEANYAFLLKPPDADTPFFFAPWPWYIPVLIVMALGMFALVYLPFYLHDQWTGRPTESNE